MELRRFGQRRSGIKDIALSERCCGRMAHVRHVASDAARKPEKP
jgi:hypothetical protein